MNFLEQRMVLIIVKYVTLRIGSTRLGYTKYIIARIDIRFVWKSYAIYIITIPSLVQYVMYSPLLKLNSSKFT